MDETLGILGAAQQHVLRLMADELNSLGGLIDELRQASSFDASGPVMIPGHTDVFSLLDEVVRSRSEQLSQKDLRIELALDDELPPVYADQVSLRQILARLVDNACAVSPPASPIIISAQIKQLRLADAAETTDALEITVGDSGAGIAQTDFPRVFARKYRSDYPRIDGLSDTGVGMSIARAYLRAREGDLWVTSEAGRGSIFHLALPLQLATSIEE